MEGDEDERLTALPSEKAYTAFRTPVLVRVEEEKLFKLWIMVLDACRIEVDPDDAAAVKRLFRIDAKSLSHQRRKSFPTLKPLPQHTRTESTQSGISRSISWSTRKTSSDVSAVSNGTFSTRPSSTSRASSGSRHLASPRDSQQEQQPSPSSPNPANGSDSRGAVHYAAGSESSRFPFRAALWMTSKDEHPDELLYRFLKRHDFNVEAAFNHVADVLRWRSQEMKVDEIMLSGEHGAYEQLLTAKDPTERALARGFLEQFWGGKAFVRGHDRNGRPIVVVRVRQHLRPAQPLLSMKQFIIYLIELGRIIIGPSVDTVLFVWDLTGTDLRNHDIDVILFLRDTMVRYYPMATGQVLVHRAPRWFEGVWKLIKPLVNNGPEKADLHFTRTIEDLEKFAERDQIVREMGGDDCWEYEYVRPQPGENSMMDDTAGRNALMRKREELFAHFEALTRAMVYANTNGEDLADVRRAREECVDRLRENYWRLDPYVRSRCVYDRWGAFNVRKDAALNNANWLHWRELERQKRRQQLLNGPGP